MKDRFMINKDFDLKKLIEHGFVNDIHNDPNPKEITFDDRTESYPNAVEVMREIGKERSDTSPYISLNTYYSLSDNPGVFIHNSKVNDNWIVSYDCEEHIQDLIEIGIAIKVSCHECKYIREYHANDNTLEYCGEVEDRTEKAVSIEDIVECQNFARKEINI